MKTIADALDVSRSNLNKPGIARGPYAIEDDEWLLPIISEVVDERPTYGYRRITALLNRRFRTAGVAQVNHKRIYRVMRHANLLLQQFAGIRVDRAHDGVVRSPRRTLVGVPMDSRSTP